MTKVDVDRSPRIVEGDQVFIAFWPYVDSIVGTVRYVPSQPGDSWIIEGKQGQVHYVQHFASITKERPLGDDEPF